MSRLLEYKDQVVELVLGYAPRLVLAVFTLIIGLWLIRSATRVLGRVLSRQGMDATLAPFVTSLVGWLLKAVLFISIASMVGVQTTSMVAILGAAGLAVGLALQGSLANFAGGVLILIFRPYKVGDLIEAQGQLGVVQHVQIFTTTLLSPQNQTVVIPNGVLSNGTIVNYSVAGLIRVDLEVGIAYDSDVAQAKQVLSQVLGSDPRVLADPAPLVAVSSLADSAVVLAVRPHCRPADYWGVYFDTLERCKLALDAAKISIPFPQRDVHLYDHSRGRA